MTEVEILIQPTGCVNGQNWPAAGERIKLGKDAAEAMAAAGWVRIVETPKVEKRPAAKKATEKR